MFDGARCQRAPNSCFWTMENCWFAGKSASSCRCRICWVAIHAAIASMMAISILMWDPTYWTNLSVSEVLQWRWMRRSLDRVRSSIPNMKCYLYGGEGTDHASFILSALDIHGIMPWQLLPTATKSNIVLDQSLTPDHGCEGISSATSPKCDFKATEPFSYLLSEAIPAKRLSAL